MHNVDLRLSLSQLERGSRTFSSFPSRHALPFVSSAVSKASKVQESKPAATYITSRQRAFLAVLPSSPSPSSSSSSSHSGTEFVLSPPFFASTITAKSQSWLPEFVNRARASFPEPRPESDHDAKRKHLHDKNRGQRGRGGSSLHTLRTISSFSR